VVDAGEHLGELAMLTCTPTLTSALPSTDALLLFGRVAVDSLLAVTLGKLLIVSNGG